MTKRVLITRPQELAVPLAAKLEAIGCAAWIEPVLSFEPLPKRRPEGAFEGVLLTSRLALVALKERRGEVADLLSFPCYAVGERTAQDARAFGFQDVREGGGNGQALAELAAQEAAPCHFLHVGGEDLALTGWDRLAKTGRTVVHWPVYRAAPREAFSPSFVEKARHGGFFDAALFFSPRTAKIYVQLAQKSGLSLCGAGAIGIGLSEAVAVALRPLPWREVRVAKTPDEEAVIAEVLG